MTIKPLSDRVLIKNAGSGRNHQKVAFCMASSAQEKTPRWLL